MIMSKTPVITVNIGTAYSGGALLLLAGQERYAFKYSKAMIHSGSTSGGGGTFEQNEAAQKNYKQQIDDMAEFILERSSIDSKTFKRNRTKDWYFSSDDQIKYGLVNKIVTDLDELF